MLDVKHNRLDYGQLLIPPEGCELTQAVATTYSVDLDTLLSIPVALFYAQTLEGQLQGKDVQLIRAIQQTAGMLTIYHQKGQVKVPRSAKEIYAYFEDSLAPILPDGPFASFHPKTWVLRYRHKESPDDVTYRLIVLSRNLTFDRCWDVAAFLQGKPEADALSWNKPLFDFHAWLDQQRPLRNGPGFLSELKRVNFAVPECFDDYGFHPVGIFGYQTNPVGERRAQRLLCLSPFLHKQATETLWSNVGEWLAVLSRRAELERLSPELLEGFDAYCLSDVIVDGERLAGTEEADGEPREQDLHAKVFLFDDETGTTWFLGSANATKAAFEHNVEFLLELNATDHDARLGKVYEQLLGDDQTGEMFIRFDPAEGGKPEEVAKQRAAIRRMEYAILRAPMEGRVSRSENQQTYDLAIALDLRNVPRRPQFSAGVRPLVPGTHDQNVRFGERNEFCFGNISETHLSRFLRFTLFDCDDAVCEFLVCVHIEGMPEGRLDNIFKSIVNSREKFLAYLRFLLTDEPSKEEVTGDGNGARGGTRTGLEMPIFEQLLITASRNPRRLIEVDRVITSLRDAKGESVVPNEFLSLWEVFKAAIPPVEESHA